MSCDVSPARRTRGADRLPSEGLQFGAERRDRAVQLAAERREESGGRCRRAVRASRIQPAGAAAESDHKDGRPGDDEGCHDPEEASSPSPWRLPAGRRGLPGGSAPASRRCRRGQVCRAFRATPLDRRRDIGICRRALLDPSDELVDLLPADGGGRFGSLSTGIRLRGRLSRGGWSAVRGVLIAGGAVIVAFRRATCDESTKQIPRGLRRRDACRRWAPEPRARLARLPALFQLVDVLVICNRRHPDLPCRIAVVEQG